MAAELTLLCLNAMLVDGLIQRVLDVYHQIGGAGEGSVPRCDPVEAGRDGQRAAAAIDKSTPTLRFASAADGREARKDRKHRVSTRGRKYFFD